MTRRQAALVSQAKLSLAVAIVAWTLFPLLAWAAWAWGFSTSPLSAFCPLAAMAALVALAGGAFALFMYADASDRASRRY